MCKTKLKTLEARTIEGSAGAGAGRKGVDSEGEEAFGVGGFAMFPKDFCEA